VSIHCNLRSPNQIFKVVQYALLGEFGVVLIHLAYQLYRHRWAFAYTMPTSKQSLRSHDGLRWCQWNANLLCVLALVLMVGRQTLVVVGSMEGAVRVLDTVAVVVSGIATVLHHIPMVVSNHALHSNLYNQTRWVGALILLGATGVGASLAAWFVWPLGASFVAVFVHQVLFAIPLWSILVRRSRVIETSFTRTAFAILCHFDYQVRLI
jgi:hypothetical protein